MIKFGEKYLDLVVGDKNNKGADYRIVELKYFS